MGENGSIFGSEWLFAFLIIVVIFGGLGGGGLLGGGAGRPMPDVATKDFVLDAVNNQTNQNNFQQLLLATERNNFETVTAIGNQTRDYMAQNNTNMINVIQGFNALNQKMDQLGYQQEQCCCKVMTQMLQDKYDALLEKYHDKQTDLSNAQQTQTILNALGRFVAYPPAAAAAATT